MREPAIQTTYRRRPSCLTFARRLGLTARMLYLVPIRYALMAIFLLVAATVLLAVYAGVIGTGDALADTKWAIRWMTTAALVLTIVPQLLWRWIPFVQTFVFPYLGGHWQGTIEFERTNGQGTRDVSMTINHSLMGITLILDSEESTSRTLTAQADRDTGINRDRLYYVYLNERKEVIFIIFVFFYSFLCIFI